MIILKYKPEVQLVLEVIQPFRGKQVEERVTASDLSYPSRTRETRSKVLEQLAKSRDIGGHCSDVTEVRAGSNDANNVRSELRQNMEIHNVATDMDVVCVQQSVAQMSLTSQNLPESSQKYPEIQVIRHSEKVAPLETCTYSELSQPTSSRNAQTACKSSCKCSGSTETGEPPVAPEMDVDRVQRSVAQMECRVTQNVLEASPKYPEIQVVQHPEVVAPVGTCTNSGHLQPTSSRNAQTSSRSACKCSSSTETAESPVAPEKDVDRVQRSVAQMECRVTQNVLETSPKYPEIQDVKHPEVVAPLETCTESGQTQPTSSRNAQTASKSPCKCSSSTDTAETPTVPQMNVARIQQSVAQMDGRVTQNFLEASPKYPEIQVVQHPEVIAPQETHTDSGSLQPASSKNAQTPSKSPSNCSSRCKIAETPAITETRVVQQRVAEMEGRVSQNLPEASPQKYPKKVVRQPGVAAPQDTSTESGYLQPTSSTDERTPSKSPFKYSSRVKTAETPSFKSYLTPNHSPLRNVPKRTIGFEGIDAGQETSRKSVNANEDCPLSFESEDTVVIDDSDCLKTPPVSKWTQITQQASSAIKTISPYALKTAEACVSIASGGFAYSTVTAAVTGAFQIASASLNAYKKIEPLMKSPNKTTGFNERVEKAIDIIDGAAEIATTSLELCEQIKPLISPKKTSN